MFDVLEHIECDVDFLKKLKCHATQKHTLLFSVPACPFLFCEHDILLNHYRRYSITTLKNCLIQAGYNPISIRYYMFFPFPLVFIARFIDKLKAFFGFRRKHVDVGIVPSMVNAGLISLLNFESVLSQYIRFPIGVWLFCIAESDQQQT